MEVRIAGRGLVRSELRETTEGGRPGTGRYGPWIEIHNLAVRRDVQRQGIGSQLVGHLMSYGRRLVRATVSERDLDAQLFFRGLDFRAVRAVRDTPDDWYVMEHCK